MLFQVKYKEKYEKEKGKAMLDFETPSYVTAKEAQHMQSQVNAPSASSHILYEKPTNAAHLLHQPSLSSSLSAFSILTWIIKLLVIYRYASVCCHILFY